MCLRYPELMILHAFGARSLPRTLETRPPAPWQAHLRLVLTNGLERIELPLVRAAFLNDVTGAALDDLMDVVLPVKETRVASRSIGHSFLRAVNGVRRCEVEAEHHAVVFGAVLREWQLNLNDGLHVYAFQALRQQLSAAQHPYTQQDIDQAKAAVAQAQATLDQAIQNVKEATVTAPPRSSGELIIRSAERRLHAMPTSCRTARRMSERTSDACACVASGSQKNTTRSISRRVIIAATRASPPCGPLSSSSMRSPVSAATSSPVCFVA